MRPVAPVRHLRGKDPVTVEIELNALSTKPLGQIACENVADLFALEELADLPAGFRVRLKGFRDRIARAVADLPNGSGLQAWVDALSEVPADRVPPSLRAVVEEQAVEPKRLPADRELIEGLLRAWSQVEPLPFAFGAPKRVQQLPARGRRDDQPKRGRAAAGVRDTPKPKAKPKPAPRATFGVDAAKQLWIRQTALERLSTAIDQGLLEVVLLAGIKHRGRDRYPELTDADVRSELNQLLSDGLATRSAGRWKRSLGR